MKFFEKVQEVSPNIVRTGLPMEGPPCFHTIKNLLRHIMRPPEIETVKCPNSRWILCVQTSVS